VAVRYELRGDVDVRVVSASDTFLFNPSLIWLPFGKRSPADITFPLEPTFESHGVDFVHAAATGCPAACRPRAKRPCSPWHRTAPCTTRSGRRPTLPSS
jgi:hypothetical protein